MAVDEKKLILRLEAENAKLLRKLEQSEKQVKKFSNRAKSEMIAFEGSLSRTFRRVGIALLATFGTREIINATKKQQAALTQLRQGLESTNNVVGQSFDELVKKAQDFQKISIFGDEEIIQAQSQLITFTNIVGDQFDKTIELAADLSVRMGQDLKSSIVQLGKALNDPITNLSALSRVGIQFDESQKNLIKTLFKSGKIAEAQTEIFKELEKEFGGSARAARDDFGGALTALANASSDLLEANNLGGVVNNINQLTDILQDPQTQKAAEIFTGSLLKGFSELAKVTAKTINAIQYLAEEAAAGAGNKNAAYDDIVRSEERINILMKRREDILKSIQRAETLFNDYQRGPVIERFQQQLDTVDAEIKARQNALEELRGQSSQQIQAPQIAEIELNLDEQQKAFNESILSKPLKEFEKTLKSLATPQEMFNQQLAQAQLLLNNNQINLDEYSKVVSEYVRALVDSTDEQKQYNKDLEEAARITEEAKTPFENLVVQLNKLKDLHERGLISDQTLERTLKKMEALSDKANETGKEMSVYWDEALRTLQGGLADVFVDGFDNGLKSMAESFKNFLKRAAAELAASKILELLTAVFGGSAGSNSGTTAAAAFAGAFADGGSIPAGQFGLVGESGPELISGPATVFSQSNMKSMGDNITVNIDARNADPYAAAQLAQLGKLLEQRILATITDRKARGRL